MKKILFVVLAFLSALCFSQALSGTYIIGKSQPAPFNTITAAINRINTVGVSGPVTFLLNDDNYNNTTGESFPIKILQFAGTSSSNTLRIKPNTGKDVTVSAVNINDYTGVPAVFHLEGADNIIIDGSNVNGGTSRNLTISNNDGVEYVARTAVWLSSTGTNNASNVRISHTRLQVQNRNQPGIQLSGVFVGNNAIGSNNQLGGGMATAAHNSLTFSSNEFINVRQGIIVNGSDNSSLKTSNITISGNQMGSSIDAQKPNVPVQISNAANVTIADNRLTGFANTSSSNSQLGLYVENGSQIFIRKNIFEDFKTTGSYRGRVISIGGSSSQVEVTENKISNVRNEQGGPIYGIEVNISAASTGVSLANNFIGNIASNGGSTNSAHGIYITNGTGTKIYHNTVAMNTPQVGWSSALYIAGGSGFDVRNNIFTNSSTTQSYALYSEVAANAFTAINYNNYRAHTVGFLGGQQTTLANWRNATGKDQNSLNVLPAYTGIDDLHLLPANNPELDNKGQALPAVTIDIDQQARSTTSPDMGADEFSVPATEPTSPASKVTFRNVTASGFTIDWTIPIKANSLVVMSAVTEVNSAPTDGTDYTANPIFGSGSQTGTGNFVVYSGSGTSVDVSNLNPNTLYHVAVFTFNGAGPTSNYRITSPARGEQRTLNATLGWQILSMNNLHRIDFDTTVSGVNLDRFVGSGFDRTPVTGKLNSNSWSVMGLADGNLPLGGVNTNPGFGRGSSNGGVSAGGIYAYNVATNNAALGVQPTANDFNSGSMTLRMQNQTSAPITSVNIGYKVYIYNDQPGSSSFNFSHSADNSTFTNVSQLNVTSPATADEAPSWKASYRVVTVTGLNINPNEYYYFKWTGNTVTAGAADEFALDDITVSANPVSNFANFQGVAQDFVVHGNADMDGNLIVNGPLTLSAGKLSIKSSTLTIGGTVNNTVSGGLRGSSASNLTITGTGTKTISLDQTTQGTTNLLNNFSVPFSATNSNTVDIFGNISVNGSLSVGLSQQVNLGTNVLSGNLSSISIIGELLTQNTSATPFPSGKTFTGTGTLTMNAPATAQTLVPGTYTNVSLRSAAGTNASGNLTVNGILSLPNANPSATKGSLDMGTYTLTMGPEATNAGVGDVTGIITRNSFAFNVLYTFGHPDSSILFTNSGTLPSSMSAKVMIGTAPNWRAGAIQRYYDIIQTGAQNTKAVIRQHYLDSELNRNSEPKLVYWAKTETAEVEQGRSNFNPTENWVEISNANIGLYFQSTFGKVFITLDEYLEGTGTDPLVLVWNGSVSDSWITAANWTPNATPSQSRTLYIPDARTTDNNPTLLEKDFSLAKNLIIQPGGVVNSPNTATLQIFGGEGAWINNGTFNSGSGDAKVVFMSADATMAGSTEFNNLEVAASASLRALENNYAKINGALTNGGTILFGLTPNTVEFSGTNQTVPAPNGASLAAYYNLTFSGRGTVVPASLNVRGNLTFNSAVNLAGKDINLTGEEDQMIGGSASINFNNLNVNKSRNNVILNKDITVGGTLNLTKGVVVLGPNNLTLGANAVQGTFDVTTMIAADGAGMVRRPFTSVGEYFFPVGDLSATPGYSPIRVKITSGTFIPGALLNVSLADDIHPDNHSHENYISRYWKIQPEGMTNTVATVTANYLTTEVLVDQSTMAAAQLTGTFNQQTNPWKRFAPLENFTLTAEGASLPSNVMSYFTAIKAGPYSVAINSKPNYCEGQEALLSAQVTGGDLPFTYEWSGGLGNAATATALTVAAGTAIYTLTVKDANGIATSREVTITVVPGLNPGTISIPNNIACVSYAPDDISLSGNNESVLYWQKSYFEDFSNYERIDSNSTTLTGQMAGIITGKTYFRAVIGNANCGLAYTNTIIVDTKTSTFTDTGWTNGIPDVRTEAVILNDLITANDLLACRLTVANNAKVTVSAGKNILLTGSLNVSPGATLTMENNTNLVQTEDEVNHGIIAVKRNSSPLYRLDYTMWGSPLYGNQTLQQFSPQTLSDRFYIYNTATNVFNNVTPSNTYFSPGQAFLIRMRNNHVSYSTTTPPQIWTGVFSGTPTNGRVKTPLSGAGQGFNMIANPYASTIKADDLLSTNQNEIEGTLYFWRRRNNTPDPGITTAYYATYTTAGGTAVPSSDPNIPAEKPNGIIQVGQGFLVQKKAGGTGQLIFNNAMRTADNKNQFFRGGQAEDRSRIWLNVTNTAGTFGQTLIAYMDSADNGVDRTDGKYLGDGTTALTSWVNDSEYIIQGRAPFQTSDIVPLHFRTLTAGIYTITLAEKDGIFANGQAVYIKDKQNGTTHNLQQSPYSFSSEAGAFSSRFEIVYANGVLSANDSAAGNGILLFKQNGEAVIRSSEMNLELVEVYDMNGRLVANARNIHAKELRLPLGQVNQVLIFRITTADGVTISKKMVN
ncbi:fibronectin type III domain-containing protein [Kaistella rhinocerotis]|uniref:fibronectin type III domain-containing protein n=1 Tax=Kaistella rhinocerotis TaxID=3026437 RepID=UPI002555CB2A|nr:hypothetical protein [Kaistella sp. Ran72]